VLNFHFTLAEPVIQAIGPVRLHAETNGFRLKECEYDFAGEQHYIEPIPPADIVGDRILIRLELDKAFAAPDGRELGVQVVFWNYDGPVPRALAPITL
jgi:hypothetical protein